MRTQNQPAATITVRVGDIVHQADCDAIVNSANPYLRAGSGVCGAIYAAAGPELEPCSRRFAPLLVGQAIATRAFQLPNRWIIHVRGPRYRFDREPAANLRRAMESVLQLADQKGMVRIAVPAISMGVYGYPPDEAVPILVKTTIDALRETKSLQEVRFVVLQHELARLFLQTLRVLSTMSSGN
jgi:O-acetyl-ADP-ribose deacetylase (regulator of RNase III)